MTLDEIKNTVKEGQTVSVTRPSWNKDYLEFWLDLRGKLEYLTLFDVLYAKKGTMGEKALFVSENTICACRDGDIIDNAFDLTTEDYNADDWVII